MDFQDIIRTSLVSGLGGIFALNFAVLIWCATVMEVKKRDELREVARTRRRKREIKGCWVCYPTYTCSAKKGGGEIRDVILVKLRMPIKGFVLPERSIKISRVERLSQAR